MSKEEILSPEPNVTQLTDMVYMLGMILSMPVQSLFCSIGFVTIRTCISLSLGL